MNHRWIGLVIALSLLAYIASSPALAESGWKMPNLNPFAGKSTDAAPPKKSSGFKMPSLVPSWAKKDSKKPSQASAWSKISDGTKQFFTKTKDVLTPWDNPPKKASSSSISQRFHMGGSSEKTKKKSFFTSWMTEKEEPKKPRSVSEFLKQPRPTP